MRRSNRLVALLSAGLLAVSASPVLADHGTGGGVDEHNGNPQAFTIERPDNGSGAFIAQIGDDNTAVIGQSANTQYARIEQNGSGNNGSVLQSGAGAHYGSALQVGSGNELELVQSGDIAQTASLMQSGDRNRIDLFQNGLGASYGSGVLALQQGSDNTMSLSQDGSNNQAALVQKGTGNVMNAIQNGDNNQLSWTQDGHGLAHLTIEQTGGQALQVTQSN